MTVPAVIGPALPLARSAYEVVPTSVIKHRAVPKGRTVTQYVAFTAVGFDHTRTRAVVEYRIGCVREGVEVGLCGHGGAALLEKQGGTWRPVNPSDVQGCQWIS